MQDPAAAPAQQAGGAPARIANPHLPIIGIVPSAELEENRLVLRNPYIDAITSCGGAPVILPLTADKRVYESLFPLMDGFLLTGGADISPERYYSTEHNPKNDTPTPLREELECLILSYAYKFDVPTLGICRGMQMMNVFFGGTLYQDLYDQFPLHDDDEPERKEKIIFCIGRSSPYSTGSKTTGPTPATS